MLREKQAKKKFSMNVKINEKLSSYYVLTALQQQLNKFYAVAIINIGYSDNVLGGK